MLLHVSSTCAHNQEVKIALHTTSGIITLKQVSGPIGLMIPEAV